MGLADDVRIAGISIHALREEGDQNDNTFWAEEEISIHALREEGDLVILGVISGHGISIHALREEGDGIDEMGRRQ